MRPRAIQSVPGLDPNLSPGERFEQFARMIVRVPKQEADTEREKEEGSKGPTKGRRRRARHHANDKKQEEKKGTESRR